MTTSFGCGQWSHKTGEKISRAHTAPGFDSARPNRFQWECLCKKLVDAQKELDKGKSSQAIKKVQDFLTQVEKERTKGTITTSAATVMADWANCVLTTWR